MSPLHFDLANTDFDQLVTLSRSLIPKLAPEWTDNNLHDPGIMLIELLAWTADAQIYSLARVRHDERAAYAALFGLAARGARPATTLVWPAATPVTAVLEVANTLIDATSSMPSFRLDQTVFKSTPFVECTPAVPVRVETHLHDGTVVDQSASLRLGGFDYQPFGSRPRRGDQLRVSFDRPLQGLSSTQQQDTCLTLGIQVSPRTTPAALLPLDIDDAGLPDSNPCRHFDVSLFDGLVKHRVRVAYDGTTGFQRTGVIVLAIGQALAATRNCRTIAFECRSGGFPGAPRIRAIVPNVLPIEQVLDGTQTFVDGTNGQPDFGVTLTATPMDSGRKPPLKVTFDLADGSTDEWKPAKLGDFASHGPLDKVYVYDSDLGTLRFGNGVNGSLPPAGVPLVVAYSTTAGQDGNGPRNLKWRVGAVATSGVVYGVNREAVVGGAAADEATDLQRLARLRSRESHPIVTSQDVADAALALPDLDVARIEELSAALVASAPRELRGMRTLVAMRDRLGAPVDLDAPPESPEWLAEIRRRLAGRLLLGERMRFVAPAYSPLSVAATLEVRRGEDPVAIVNSARDMLARHFQLVPDASGTSLWPFGRRLEPLDLRARLRALPGVARVSSCTLLRPDGSSWQAPADVAPNWLPLFLPELCVITAARSTTEAPS